MALKFRRGTTAQQSGSLAFGEPYFNTDYNTLLVGSLAGDVVLSAAGATSAFVGASVSASSFVSASSLKITGNASIDGNVAIGGTITIGDASSDTVNVVASLSSSLIPSVTNTFDLGSVDKIWKDLYISTGSIKFVNGDGTIGGVLSSLDGKTQFSNDIVVAYDENTTIGVTVGKGAGSNTTFNTAVGWNALASNTTGVQNTAIGANALVSNTAGESNTVIGANAMADGAGNSNTIIGAQAGVNLSQGFNTAVGHNALFGAHGADSNVAIGYEALRRLNDGNTNTAIGYQAGQYSSGSSAQNVYVGYQAGPTASVVENSKLYINNAASNKPLIGGDFVQRTITVDGDFIPATTNARDLGSIDHIWRDLYISTGSIKMVSNGVVVSTLSNTGNGFALDQGITANGDSSFGTSSAAVTSVTGSLRVSGSVSVIGSVSASTINGIGNVTDYSTSVDSRIVTNKNSAAGAFASASAYSASASTNIITAQNSANGAFASASAYSASAAVALNSLSSSIATTDSTQTTNIATATAAAAGAFASASAYSASAATALSSLSASVATTDSASAASTTGLSASAATALSGLSSSVATTINNASSSAYSTFAKLNADNVFTGTQTITGSLYVSANLVVQGSSSVQNITASAASIGTNTVILNTATPSVRFGGIAVQDSGSGAGASGSLLWDSQNDVWLYTQPSGAPEGYGSARLISGPKNSGSLGGELGLTVGQVPVAVGDDHIGDSIISASATKVTVAGGLDVTGALSASTLTGVGNVSAFSTSVDSRLITNSNAAAGAFASASAYSSSAATSFSASLASQTALSASIASTDSTQTTNISTATAAAAGAYASASAYSASAASALSSLSSSVASTDATQTTNIATATAAAAGAYASASAYSGSFYTTINTVIGTVTTAQNSANGAYASASAYSSSAYTSISASNAEHTAFSASFANNTVTFNGSPVKLGGSATIKASTTNVLTIGTGLSGTSFDGSSAVTIANTGVTSNVAGTGISVSGATGAVTITNTGVTSAVAGTGVSVSGATGAVTFSIGQAVATTSAVTFASVTATGDIVAYSTSDKRHKNSIQTIPNALEKVSKLNGVTWEWNDDVDDVTKLSPKTGLIAQEVQEVLPEVVTERENGYLGLDYSKMVGLLVEAIKEQQTQIHSLKLEVENLKKNNSL